MTPPLDKRLRDVLFFVYSRCAGFKVHKGIIRETEEPVAIKVMTKARLGERALQMLAAEINILRTLEHRESLALGRPSTMLLVSSSRSPLGARMG